MPINQRLVHLAMPSGTSLCAEGWRGTGSEAGTGVKPSLILLVGVSVPRPNGSRVGRARHEKKRESSTPVLRNASLHVVNMMEKCSHCLNYKMNATVAKKKPKVKQQQQQ